MNFAVTSIRFFCKFRVSTNFLSTPKIRDADSKSALIQSLTVPSLSPTWIVLGKPLPHVSISAFTELGRFPFSPLLSWTFPSRFDRTQPSLFCFQGRFCFHSHSIYYTYIRAAAAPWLQEHHVQCQTKCKFG